MEELPKAHVAEAKGMKEYWHFHRNLFNKVSLHQVTKKFMDLEQRAKDPRKLNGGGDHLLVEGEEQELRTC